MNFIRTALFSCAIVFLSLMNSGCDDGHESFPVDRVKVRQGDEQCALPGERFPLKVRVEAEGPLRRGLFSSSRPPAAGRKLRLRTLPGSELRFESEELATDAGGSAVFEVRAGKKTGDQYLQVVPEDDPGKSITLRFISGMSVSGDRQQAGAGRTAEEPVVVHLTRPDGKPAVNVPVYFAFTPSSDGEPIGASVRPEKALTDARGNASAMVRAGEKTGVYNLSVEVSDPENGFFVRAANFKLFGLNVSGVIIAVMGGLAIFIFGMKIMSGGLQKVAGDSMKKIIQFFASNRFVAVCAGATVTAVIQASAATTIMVIGFINAGLLNLQQAVGIIFGANIGTTVTAQIISFNLSGIALPAITLGFLITLSKRRTVSGWGETLLGFGLLFFGMQMMSEELKTLGKFQNFIDFFNMFDCAPTAPGGFMPFGAVMGALTIGIVMTILIQSSSAAMGVILALAAGNLINFYTALPLLLGTNIGTTVTAMLASFGTNRVAKQAALAHTLFNVLGAVFMIALLYVPYGPRRVPVYLYFVNAVTPGDALGAMPQNLERHIAMAHTFFNVIVTALLLPFVRQFAWICNWLLPVKQKAAQTTMLEPHLLSTPSVALEQSVFAIRKMLKLAWSMIDDAVNREFLARKMPRELIKDIEERENTVDNMRSDITDYLVKITRKPLSASQSAIIPLLMHCNNDVEKIGDHAENILKLTERALKNDKTFSDNGMKDLHKMWEVLDNQAHNVIKALGSTDRELVSFALKDEKKINKMADKYENEHIERLRKGKCQLSNSVIYIEMLNELEKIGDHLSNIAERTPEIQKHYIKL